MSRPLRSKRNATSRTPKQCSVVNDQISKRKQRHKKKRKRKSESPPQRDEPTDFWFGNEDPDHVKGILSFYRRQVGVCSERSPRSRMPPKFVCVKRNRLNDSMKLMTLDEISVYLRVMVPLGSLQNYDRTEYWHTEWDPFDGVPIQSTKLNISQFENLKSRICQSRTPTYLYALPVYSTDCEFEYSCVSSAQEVGYAGPSSHCIYTSFLRLDRVDQSCFEEEVEEEDDQKLDDAKYRCILGLREDEDDEDDGGSGCGDDDAIQGMLAEINGGGYGLVFTTGGCGFSLSDSFDTDCPAFS